MDCLRCKVSMVEIPGTEVLTGKPAVGCPRCGSIALPVSNAQELALGIEAFAALASVLNDLKGAASTSVDPASDRTVAQTGVTTWTQPEPGDLN